MLTLQWNGDNYVSSHRTGADDVAISALAGRVIIYHNSWYVPHQTPNIFQHKKG